MPELDDEEIQDDPATEEDEGNPAAEDTEEGEDEQEDEAEGTEEGTGDGNEPEDLYEFDEEEEGTDAGDKGEAGKPDDAPAADATPELVVAPEPPVIEPYKAPEVWSGWSVSPDGFSLYENAMENPESEEARALRGEIKDEEGNPVPLQDAEGNTVAPWGPEVYQRQYTKYHADKSLYEEHRISEARQNAATNKVAFVDYENKVLKHFVDNVFAPKIGKEAAASLMNEISQDAVAILRTDAAEMVEDFCKQGVRRDHAIERVSEYAFAHPELVNKTLAAAIIGKNKDGRSLEKFLGKLLSAAEKVSEAKYAKPDPKAAVRGKETPKNGTGDKPVRVPVADRNASPNPTRPPTSVRSSASPDEGGGGTRTRSSDAPAPTRKPAPTAFEVEMARNVGLPDDHFAGQSRTNKNGRK